MLGRASHETGGRLWMPSSCSVLGQMDIEHRWSPVGTRGCALGPAKTGGANGFTSCWRTKMGRNLALLWQSMSQNSWGSLSASAVGVCVTLHISVMFNASTYYTQDPPFFICLGITTQNLKHVCPNGSEKFFGLLFVVGVFLMFFSLSSTFIPG